MFSATVLMNGDTDFLHGYAEGDKLGYDVRTILTIAAEDTDDALRRVFAIGNREGRDAMGREWSSDIRSVSVGDVIWLTTIEGGRLVGTAYAIEPIGHRILDGLPAAEYGEVGLVRIGVARPAGVSA